MRKYLAHLEKPICRTIGCTSIFAKRYAWPHGVVCTRLVTWLHPEWSIK